MSYYVTHENSVLNINNAHLKVSGNVQTDVLKLGAMEFAPPASDVPGTVNFTNVTTGVTTTSNLNVGGTLMLGSVELAMATNALEQTVNLGNTTSNTVQFTNATTGIVTTGNVEVGKELTVTGNATVSSNLTVSGNVEVGGELTVSGNVTVDTDTLHVDSTNNRVGIGTVSPGQKLSIYTGSTSTPALSFDRYSTDNYRTDIYQNTNGPDFRVGYGSHTPESILYLKRISDGSKEVNITGTLTSSAVRSHYDTYGFDSAWRTLIGTSAYDCGIGHLVHSTGHQYAVFWFAHAGNGTGYTGWIQNGGYTNIAYSGSNIKVQGPGGVTRGYVQFLNNS